MQSLRRYAASRKRSTSGDGRRGQGLLFFNADDGRIGGRDHKWVQDALTVTVAMFRRMGLGTNLENTKAMVCTPGFIWGKVGDLAYKRRSTGEGETFIERKKARVSCATCSVTAEGSYLKDHMARSHGICVPQTGRVDEVGGEPTT